MTFSSQNRSLRYAGNRAARGWRPALVTLTVATLAIAPLSAADSVTTLAQSGATAAPGTKPTSDSLAYAVAGRSALTPAARAEIDRVVGEGQAASRLAGRGTKATSTAVLAKRLIRCAEFEGQRYCLGLGWTQASATDAAGRIATAARTGQLTARGAKAPESTGDLDATALLRQRAKLSPDALAGLERRELTQAARSIAKIWLLRHQIQGLPLPDGFAAAHPEIRAPARIVARGGKLDPTKTWQDYPDKGRVLNETHVNDQRQTYWCGPTTMQMIAWTKKDPFRPQKYWAKRLGTTSSGTGITDMVRVINNRTDWDKPGRAGTYVVLDISDLTFGQWTQLIRRHVWDYRAPMVFHPVLLKEFYPYLDDDASGHYQVGRGYDNNPSGATKVSFFEPWNQQRFDLSEPFIERVQWRSAYKSYRANQEHYLHNMGV